MASTQCLEDAINKNDDENLSSILVRLDLGYLNGYLSSGETALYMACRLNNYKAVQHLLTCQGIDVNIGNRNNKGATPLHRACASKNSLIVNQLLAAPGINVNAKNEAGETPLHIACAKGNAQIIKALLTSPGINVNTGSTTNVTPIMYAGRVFNEETLQVMLYDPRVDILHAREKTTGYALEDLVGAELNSIGGFPSTRNSAFLLKRKCLGMIRDTKQIRSTAVSFRDCHLIASAEEEVDPTIDMERRNNYGHESEEGHGHRMIPSAPPYEELLEIVKVEKHETECEKTKQDKKLDEDSTGDDGRGLEEIRENVRIQYNDKIDKMNQNIKSKEQILARQLENKETKLKELNQRQTLEMKDVNNELEKERKSLEQDKTRKEQELAELRRSIESTQQHLTEIQQKIVRNSEEIKSKHQEELTKLKEEFKPEEEKTEQELVSMRATIDLLKKDLSNLDMDHDNETSSNNHKNLEAARKDLECPVCLELMMPPVRIWMCPSSHIICEPCKNQVEGTMCPTCRSEKITHRAFIAEHFSKSVFNNWRLARGEMGVQPVEDSKHVLKPSKKELADGVIIVEYNAATDEYKRGDGQIIKGWRNGVFEANNVDRKVEGDWNMVYLAREEGREGGGSVSWKVDLEGSGVETGRVSLVVGSKVYKTGRVVWQLCGGVACLLPQPGVQLETEQLVGSKSISLTANLGGGEGDCAWQHAQIFRCSRDGPGQDEHQLKLQISLKKV